MLQSHLCPVASLNLKAPCFIWGSIVNAPIPHSLWWMFDKNISNPNPLGGRSRSQLTMQKPMRQTLPKVLPLYIKFCVLPVMSFCLIFLPFWLIFFFNCTLLSFSSPSGSVICFTVSLDTCMICSLLLLPRSFPYSMSSHSIFLKTLSSCSEVHFWSFEIFPFSGCLVLSVPVLFNTEKNLIWQICSDVSEGELKVNGDKGLPLLKLLVVRPGPLDLSEGETQRC